MLCIPITNAILQGQFINAHLFLYREMATETSEFQNKLVCLSSAG